MNKKIVTLALGLGLAFTVAACSDGGGDTTKPSPTGEATPAKPAATSPAPAKPPAATTSPATPAKPSPSPTK